MDTLNMEEYVEQVRTEGFCILHGCLPVELVDGCNTAYQQILKAHKTAFSEKPNRGPMRMYIPLPFRQPFYDRRIFENELILAIVGKLIGEDMVISEYSTDTPLDGSVHQQVHQDLGVLFHEDPDFVHPPEIIAVNFPFIDVTPDRGPLEIARGTHRLPYSEAFKLVEEGGIPLEPVLLNRGDVLIRNPRCLHRGTPNTSDVARVVAVIGFNRWWLDRSRMVASGQMPRETWSGFSAREKKMLRVFAADGME